MSESKEEIRPDIPPKITKEVIAQLHQEARTRHREATLDSIADRVSPLLHRFKTTMEILAEDFFGRHR